MNKDNAPFHIGQKVVCLKSSGVSMGCQAIKGNIYTVAGLWECPKCRDKKVLIAELIADCEPDISCCVPYNVNETGRHCMGPYKYFAPVNPYSNSVQKELADKACEPVIEVDGPVKKIKELETQN